MQFITVSTGKKRQMIYNRELNPNSLLMLFQRGPSPHALCARDYSEAGRVKQRYGRELPWSANEIRSRSLHVFDAPTVDTNDLEFWFLSEKCN